MITAVIFDYGNTLVRFKEDELARSYTDSEEDAAKIEQIFFDRFYWSRLDEGTLSHEDWIEDAAKKLPEHLHALLPEIANSWYYRLPEIDGMTELVRTLHEKGVKLYLLSNISNAFAERIHEFPLFSLFDGIVCSAVHKVTKPDEAIYQILINTYGITPDEAIFVDDREDNIRAANALGIHGWLFDGDAARLSRYLEDIL